MSKNGLILLTPTSIAYTGTSATVSANGSVSFSACSSLSLNGVFSADYDNYMVVAWTKHTTGTQPGYLRLRAGGTDNSTASSYVRQNIEVNGTVIAAGRVTDTRANLFAPCNNPLDGTIINFYGPYLAQPTAMRSITQVGINGAYIADGAATHNQSVAYDGFTMYVVSGVYGGRVAVYGMRK